MQIKYFQSAWNDIKNSENWFGKLCLLALLNFIPIFGQIVTLGYLYGWAREISWGVHEPMPAKIFGNEDGKLYRRGWFIFVIAFVFSLIPSIITAIGSSMQQVGFYSYLSDEAFSSSGITMTVGSILYFAGIAASLFALVLSWVGYMRSSIYDRLRAGFQLGKIWKMFRHDTGGILRVLGMYLLVSLILGIILFIVITVLMTLVLFAGAAGLASAGVTVDSLEYMSDSEALQLATQFIASIGLIGFICFLAIMFIGFAVSMFLEMLVARAMGYWTWQFDVPQWRGQDDPLPFELNQAMPPIQYQ